ncbi:MAG: hypothetical protein KF725_01480 [Cyclobacteriaceae bacterium]|nr:hypothetical protein [Cyclobacteriaceae bacterium]UYN86879.1 MAG: hypothetical protein KIT51_00925 [Cyclobacteriaceae bacterium]
MFKRDLDQEKSWQELLRFIEHTLGKKPKDLNGVLFLIGVQELGQGYRLFSKEEKQDLLHIAICKVLSLAGYYELEGLDREGWPHWKLVKKLPHFDLLEQEKLLKMHVLEYFEIEHQWKFRPGSI